MPAIENVSKQVSHWLHDEQACVTIQRIVQTFQLSWEEAASVLKGVPVEGKQYSVIQFASTKKSNDNNDGCTNAFGLVKSSLDDAKEASDAEWYALALEGCTESIHTAHEKDLSTFQSEVEQFSVPYSLRPWDKPDSEDLSVGFGSSIAVAEPVSQRLATLGKRKADAFVDEPAAASKPARSFAPQKKTTTSARNFFANRSTGSSSSKSSATAKKTGGTNSKQNSSKGNSANNKAAKQSSTLSFQPKKKEEKKTGEGSKGSADEEKENVRNKSSRVGNADDLVFDEESSDEEPEEEPAAPTQSKTAPSRTQPSVDVDVEEQEEEVTPKPEEKKSKFTTNTSQKRRRKKLIEKTSTDENGYLYTETVAVWEDVPSDEEEKEIAPVKKSKPTQSKKSAARPKAMKQASLMGFFAKKK